jgi:hypothetical protein
LWCVSITSSLRRLSQEEHEFEASLGYVVRSCLKRKKKKECAVLEIKESGNNSLFEKH